LNPQHILCSFQSYTYLANNQKDKTRQDSTQLNNMLYLSSEVKIDYGGPKKSGGQFFAPELGPSHVQFASYACAMYYAIMR